MFKLALTCKTLYDKDYLDNMMLLQDKKRHPVILFNDIFDYFNKVREFQNETKHYVNFLLDDNYVWEELFNNIENVTDDIGFIKKLRTKLINNLFEFTNRTEKIWCIEMSNVFIHSVRGAIKGLYLCLENTDTNISKDFIKNMTLSSIFHIIGTHEKYLGLFDKISYFKCQNCNKLSNEIIYSENLTCLKCFNNL